MKTTTAHTAYTKAVEMRGKFVKHIYINECPDCHGTGKIGNKICSTCGNEPDDKTLIQRGTSWGHIHA